MNSLSGSTPSITETFTSPPEKNVLPVPSSPLSPSPSVMTHTPEHYAGFWIRVAAALTDSAIYLIFALLAAIILSVRDLSILTMAGKFTSMSFYFFILFLGFTIYLIQKTGATLGKKFVGIKIIFENNDKKSIGRILLRELLGKFISSIFLIGYIMAAFTKRKQSAHDMIANSVVVYEHENRKILAIFLALFSIITIIALYFGLLAGSLFSLFKQHAVVTTDTKFTIETKLSPSDSPSESAEENLSDIQSTLPTPENSSKEVVPCVGPQEKCALMKRTDDRIKRFIVEFAATTDSYRKTHGSYKNIKQEIVMRNYIVPKDFCASIDSKSIVDISPDETKLVIHQPLCSNPSKSYCYDERSTEVTLTDTDFVTTKFKCQ